MAKVKKIPAVLVVLMIAQIFIGCASSAFIESKSLTESIEINGIQDDWKDNLTYQEDEKFSYGMQNDSQNLYMIFVFSERANILKVLTTGFTIWLEPDKGGKKLGIKYPINLQETNLISMFRNRDRDADPEQFIKAIKKLIESQDEISVVNEKGFSLSSFTVNANSQFDAALGISMGRLVYELKVPLEENSLSPLVLNSNPGESLFMEIETGKLERPEMKRPGGMGVGGRRPGMSGRRMAKGEGLRNLTKKLTFSATIELAQQ